MPKPQPIEVVQSQLQAIHTDQYLISLTPIDESNAHLTALPPEKKLYTIVPMFYFSVCRISPRQGRQSQSTQVKNRYPSDLRVNKESCTSLFTNKDNKALIMIQMGNESFLEYQKKLANYFINKQAQQFNDQYKLSYIGAFGTGAGLSVFSAPVTQAINVMIPAGQKAPKLVAFGAQIGLHSSPHQRINSNHFFQTINTGVENIAHEEEQKMIDAFQKIEQGDGNIVMLQPFDAEAIEEQLDERNNKKDTQQRVTSVVTHSAAVAAGAASATVLASLGSTFGPQGTIVGQSAIPFMTAVILNLAKNPGSIVKKNFDSFLAPHSDPTMVDKKASQKLGDDATLLKILPLLAKSLVHGQWANTEQLYQYCLPKYQADTVCTPVEYSDEEKNMPDL